MGKPKGPYTCRKCGARHYASQPCHTIKVAEAPLPELPVPDVVEAATVGEYDGWKPLPLPDRFTSGTYRADRAGNLVLERGVRPHQNVIPNPDWEV